MKATVTEYQGCFSIDLKAETLAEAATLVRMGVDARKKVQGIYAFVNEGKKDNAGEEFHSAVVLKKHGKSNNHLPRRN